MESTRLDLFAKHLAKGSSRRSLLRAGAGETCLAPNQACNFDVECCHGLCRLGACRCPNGTRKCGSTCAPADRDCGCLVAGQRRCNGTCVDTRTDRQNCGACGNVCLPGKVCSGGKCCPKGTINCNGSCVLKSKCLPVT